MAASERDNPTHTSSYIGVHWHRGAGKWVAQISINCKRTHLGYFDSQEAAARKYDERAQELGRQRNFNDDEDGGAKLTGYNAGNYGKQKGNSTLGKRKVRSEDQKLPMQPTGEDIKLADFLLNMAKDKASDDGEASAAAGESNGDGNERRRKGRTRDQEYKLQSSHDFSV